MNKQNQQVLCTRFCEGKRHDLRLLSDSKVRFQENTQMIADSGYQGFQKSHSNTRIPKKRTKKRPLTKEEKQQNRQLSSDRVLNENMIGMLKRFKIIADTYRNRRRRFGLRFNLIAGIYNHDLERTLFISGYGIGIKKQAII